MADDAKQVINRLSTLRDRLQKKANDIYFAAGGPHLTPEYIDLIEMWGKVKDIVNDLEHLNLSVEIFEKGVKEGDPVTSVPIVQERYKRTLVDLQRKIKTATRLESKAKELIGDKKPEEKKVTEKKPKAEKASEKKASPAPKQADNSGQKQAEPTYKQILSLMRERGALIEDIIANMEKQVNAAQADLLRKVVEDFVDKLDRDADGNIQNTLANKRKISLLDTVYQKYLQDTGIKIVETIVQGVSKVMDFNGKYYGMFTTKAQLTPILAGTKEVIRDWLGLTNRGGLVENGYLNRILSNDTVRNEIKNSVFKSIVGQKGYFEVKKDLANYIEGRRVSGQGQTGALQQYHRNFVYDTFSQVDRTQAKIIADKIKLTYAIYEGGIIKTTRPFCRARNGKVFTNEEIEKFNPPTAKQPNYNPFTDLGGYACRHHLNYIPEVMAFALRPDLKPAA